MSKTPEGATDIQCQQCHTSALGSFCHVCGTKIQVQPFAAGDVVRRKAPGQDQARVVSHCFWRPLVSDSHWRIRLWSTVRHLQVQPSARADEYMHLPASPLTTATAAPEPPFKPGDIVVHMVLGAHGTLGKPRSVTSCKLHRPGGEQHWDLTFADGSQGPWRSCNYLLCPPPFQIGDRVCLRDNGPVALTVHACYFDVRPNEWRIQLLRKNRSKNPFSASAWQYRRFDHPPTDKTASLSLDLCRDPCFSFVPSKDNNFAPDTGPTCRAVLVDGILQYNCTEAQRNTPLLQIRGESVQIDLGDHGTLEVTGYLSVEETGIKPMLMIKKKRE